jgi:hypothetical protein
MRLWNWQKSPFTTAVSMPLKMCNERETVEQSISESLRVGVGAKCPVQISTSISSKKRWGASSITINMVEVARALRKQVNRPAPLHGGQHRWAFYSPVDL